MPITPIALNVQPLQLPDPLAAYGKIAAIKGAQQENALAQMKMDALRREETQTNALSRAYAEAYDPATGAINYNKLTATLSGAGQGAAIPDVEKSRREAETANLQRQKVLQEIIAGKTIRFRDAAGQINPNDPQAPAQLARLYEAAYKDEHLGPLLSQFTPVDEVVPRIQTAVQQGQFPEFLQRQILGAEKFMEINKPTFQTQDLGNFKQVLQIPAMGGAATVVPGSRAAVAPGPRQPTEFEIALNMLPPNLRPAAIQTKAGLSNPNEVAYTFTDEAGNVQAINKMGQLVPITAANAAPGAPGQMPTPVEIKGKPSATFEKTRVLRQQQAKDLDYAIKELESAATDGGLIDQSTGSGVGRAVDFAAGVVGQATPGAIAIGKLQPIADLVLKQVPRFEGPQSDKDTQSYKEAAGQLANGSLPNKIRKEAARTIIKLMKDRKGQFVSQEMATEGLPAERAAPAGGADIDALLNKYK